MLVRIVTILCLLAVSPVLASDIHQRITDNGLTILTRANHAAPVAHVVVYVRAGSITEGQWLGYGISHITEHLVAGGSTHNRTDDEINAIVESIGNQANAYTTKDHTAYFMTVPSEHVNTAIDLLSDQLTSAAFTPEEFEREKGVVTREIEKGLSEPARVRYNAMMETMFTQHPVRYPVIGYLDVFERITRQDIVDYFNERYAPNNMIAVAVGDFDPVEIAERIEQGFAHAPRRPIPDAEFPREPRQQGPRHREVGMDINAAYLAIAFRTVPLDHSDLYPLDVLSFILTNGDSSRLVRTLRDELGLVTSIHSYSHTPRYDAGIFAIGMELRPENIDAAIEAVQAELDALRTKKVSPRELRTAKRQKQAELVLGLQQVQDQARSIGVSYMATGNPDFDSLYVDNIQQVTADDVQTMLDRYFVDSNRTVVSVLPSHLADATQEAVASAGERARPNLTQLDNGVRVLHLHNDAIPMVHVYAAMSGGVAFENDETAGITSLMGRTMTRGAGKWNAQQIAEYFDGIGGSSGPTAGYNSFGFSMSILADDFEEALPYFAAQLLQPTFPPREMERMREQQLDALAHMDDNWTVEAMRMFRQAMFADSPYKHTAEGNVDALQSLTRDDLRDFHARVVRPDNLVIAVYGDLDAHRLASGMDKHFGKLAAQGEPFPPLPETTFAPEGKTVRKQTDKAVGAIYMGYPGMTVLDNDDRDAMTVLEAVLAGIRYPGGRLHNELRGEQLVYVVHAFNAPGAIPGFFGVYAGTQPEKVDEVVGRIEAHIERIKQEPVAEEDLQQGIEMAIAAEALTNQTNAAVAQRNALNELYGLGYDYDETYGDRLRRITAQDVMDVARKYLTTPVIAIAAPPVEISAAE